MSIRQKRHATFEVSGRARGPALAALAAIPRTDAALDVLAELGRRYRVANIDSASRLPASRLRRLA